LHLHVIYSYGFREPADENERFLILACIRISAPESAEFRSAWLLNRSADRFTEFC
jgi:hypothetical protein